MLNRFNRQVKSKHHTDQLGAAGTSLRSPTTDRQVDSCSNKNQGDKNPLGYSDCEILGRGQAGEFSNKVLNVASFLRHISQPSEYPPVPVSTKTISPAVPVAQYYPGKQGCCHAVQVQSSCFTGNPGKQVEKGKKGMKSQEKIMQENECRLAHIQSPALYIVPGSSDGWLNIFPMASATLPAGCSLPSRSR